MSYLSLSRFPRPLDTIRIAVGSFNESSPSRLFGVLHLTPLVHFTSNAYPVFKSGRWVGSVPTAPPRWTSTLRNLASTLERGAWIDEDIIWRTIYELGICLDVARIETRMLCMGWIWRAMSRRSEGRCWAWFPYLVRLYGRVDPYLIALYFRTESVPLVIPLATECYASVYNSKLD